MAYGMGTTIVSDPPLMPTVNFGPQFSHNTCSKVFKVTNNGRRSQQLYWMTEGFSNYKAKLKKERQNKELDKITQVNSQAILNSVLGGTMSTMGVFL